LAGTNTYTGDTTLTNGTIRLGSDDALGNAVSSYLLVTAGRLSSDGATEATTSR
jgi:hypothetical protein